MSEDQAFVPIDQQAIDQAISVSPITLRFPIALERQFERETSASRSRRLALGGLIGLAIYDLLIISDWWLTPDILSTALWIRFAVVTPIELIAILALWLGPTYVWRETIIALLGALLPTATNLYIMLCSASPFRNAQHQSIVLVILFALLVQRVRFLFAIPTCLMCAIIYAWALSRLPEYPLEREVAANLVLLSAIVLSLFVSYSLEWEYRRNYMLNLKSRMQNRILNAMSNQDPLTGLQNRRSLDERITAIGSSEEIISVIIADIDHFKGFNDAAGHQAGDRCLNSVATLLQKTLVEADATVFRYGGEEFLVLLPGRDFHDARVVAEKLRLSIERARIHHPGLPGTSYVTASFGVATGRALGSAEVKQVIGGSDAALYAAKRNGRNQVWPPLARNLPTESDITRHTA